MTAKDAGDAVTMLQSLASSTFDSSELVLCACVGYRCINESQLQDLRMKYRPKVLAKFSERKIDESKWHESYGPLSFSSKLYNYDKAENGNHDLEAVNQPNLVGANFPEDCENNANLKHKDGEVLLDDDVLNGVLDNRSLLSDLINQVSIFPK
jgi:hypothetical protein